MYGSSIQLAKLHHILSIELIFLLYELCAIEGLPPR